MVIGYVKKKLWTLFKVYLDFIFNHYVYIGLIDNPKIFSGNKLNQLILYLLPSTVYMTDKSWVIIKM